MSEVGVCFRADHEKTFKIIYLQSILIISTVLKKVSYGLADKKEGLTETRNPLIFLEPMSRIELLTC